MDFYKKIDLRYKVVFYSVFIGIVIAHGTILFNKYSVNDDVVWGAVGFTWQAGRWGLELLKAVFGSIFGFDGGVNTYPLNLEGGIYVAILTTLTLCIMIKLLDLKRIETCILISFLFISSPFFIMLFGYNLCLPYYNIAFFLAVYGTYLVYGGGNRKKTLFGIVCIVFSLSIYQAFLPTVLTLILICFMKDTLNNNYSFKVFTKKGLYFVLIMVVSLLIYVFTVQVSLTISNLPLTDYQGISKVTSEGVIIFLKGIQKAYQAFFFPFKLPEGTVSGFFPLNSVYLYFVVLILTVLMCCYKTFTLFRENKTKAIEFLVLILIVPAAVNFIYIMCATSNKFHQLMLLNQLMLFVFTFWLFENMDLRFDKFKISWRALLISTICVVIIFCKVSNITYFKANYMQSRAISYFTTMVTRIKSINGYKDDYPVVYITQFNKRDINIEKLPFINYYISPFGDMNYYINTWTWKTFVNNWIGYKPIAGNLEKFKKLNEVKAMPHYPDDGSIKIINKTVVVKF